MTLTTKETEYPCCFDTRTNHVIYYDKEPKRPPIIDEYFGHLEVVPRSTKILGNENECVFVCGGSGSGKSHLIRQYASNYRRLYPDNDIFIITQSSEKNIDDRCRIFTADMRNGRTYGEFLRLKSIDIYSYFNDDNREELGVIDITRDFRDCLVIFDDFAYICGRNKKETTQIRENINAMISQILNLGRKLKVSCIVSSHLLYDRAYNSLFQSIYSECNKICFSYSNINRRQLSYVLKSYFGFEREELGLLARFDNNTHMIIFNKRPAFMLSENRLKLLDI